MASPKRSSSGTREKILIAAVGCFADFGFEGTHFSDITKGCGVGRTAILYHFKNKEVLWRFAVESIVERFEAAIARIYDAYISQFDVIDDRARAQAAMLAFVDSLVEIPEYGMIYIREGTRPGERLEWLVQNLGPAPILQVRIDDPKVHRRLRKTIVRDIVSSSLISVVTLGPILDLTLARARGEKRACIFPITDERKMALVTELLELLFRPSIE